MGVRPPYRERQHHQREDRQQMDRAERPDQTDLMTPERRRCHDRHPAPTDGPVRQRALGRSELDETEREGGYRGKGTQRIAGAASSSGARLMLGFPLTCHVNILNMKLISLTSWSVAGLRQHMRPARKPQRGPSIGKKSCRSMRARTPVTKHCAVVKFPSTGRGRVRTLESGPTTGQIDRAVPGRSPGAAK